MWHNSRCSSARNVSLNNCHIKPTKLPYIYAQITPFSIEIPLFSNASGKATGKGWRFLWLGVMNFVLGLVLTYVIAHSTHHTTPAIPIPSALVTTASVLYAWQTGTLQQLWNFEVVHAQKAEL